LVTVKIKDKTFELLLSKEEIEKRIAILAEQLNDDYKGKNPLFIVILNGAFIFAAELFKQLKIECEVTFTRLSSYIGTSSTGKVSYLLQLSDTVKNKDIVIVEDIVDTGETLASFLPHLELENPASIKIITLLIKPDAFKKDIKVDYKGFSIENKFVIGFGLDYGGFGRNLPGIYQLKTESYTSF